MIFKMSKFYGNMTKNGINSSLNLDKTPLSKGAWEGNRKNLGDWKNEVEMTKDSCV